MSSTGPVTELHLRNEIVELERLHAAVDAFGAAHELPNRVVLALNLALDECVTNIVEYGYDDTGVHDIVIRLCMEVGTDGRGVTIQIEDDARPFDPLTVPAPRLDTSIKDRAVGGLGIHLVRRCIDTVAYERVGNRNRLLLRKRVVG